MKGYMEQFYKCKADGTAIFPGPKLSNGTAYYCAHKIDEKENQCGAKICPLIRQKPIQEVNDGLDIS